MSATRSTLWPRAGLIMPITLDRGGMRSSLACVVLAPGDPMVLLSAKQVNKCPEMGPSKRAA
jgi:hypothetical protein